MRLTIFHVKLIHTLIFAVLRYLIGCAVVAVRLPGK